MVQFNDNVSQTRMGDLRAQEEERYVEAVAPTMGFSYINLLSRTLNPEALPLIPEAIAKDLGLVCFDKKQKHLSIAAKSPKATSVQTYLNDLITQGYTLEVYMCSRQSLEHGWSRYKDIVNSTTEKKGVLEISPADITRLRSQIKVKEDIPKLLATINTINNVRKISETIELVFAGALALRASDIHIEPEARTVRVRYRFDGVLHDIVDIDPYVYERMISRLKLLSGMVLNSRKIAQDGRFTFSAGEQEIEIRSSIIPGAVGESIVMRILDPSVASFSMENLHLNPYIIEVIRHQIKKPNGLIVTTGPTGSGKTTALYAFLREVHNPGVKIITIENPIEYKIEGIVQTQVSVAQRDAQQPGAAQMQPGLEQDYTFASGLRAILRQDPDIIMVGEIRDAEVAEVAIHAAQTGHLVFSTLHTNSAAASFARLIDLGIDPRLFGTSVNLILGQRLVRMLCKECKETYEASEQERAIISVGLKQHPFPPTIPALLTLYRPVGCQVCGGTGFKGRAAVFEGIAMDTAVEEAILRDPREHIIIEAARPQKIPSMLEDGLVKVIDGTTSLEELRRMVELPQVSASSTSTPPRDEDAAFLAHTV